MWLMERMFIHVKADRFKDFEGMVKTKMYIDY